MTDENVGSDQDNSHQITNHPPRTGCLPFWPPVMYAFLAPFGPIGALAMVAKMVLIIVALWQFVFGIFLLTDKDNSGWAHISSALLVALMRYGPFLLISI